MQELKKKIYPKIGKYRYANNLLALFNISLTFFLVLLTYKLERYLSFYLLIPLLLFRSLLYVRAFVITHDLGHEAYFSTKKLNTFFGYLTAGFIGVAFSRWKNEHDFHHKTSNDLHYDQFSQTAPLTVNVFKTLNSFSKKMYCYNYSTKGLITTMPLMFVVRNITGCFKIDRISLVILLISIYVRKSLKISFLFDFCAIFFSAVIGILLFHVQHTFTDTERAYDKDKFINGLKHSSFFHVPEIFKFFTHGIEYHHIHHLNARIPAYFLRKCHEELENENPEIWKEVKNIYLKDLISIELLLYDEAQNKLITKEEIDKINYKIK